MPAGPAFAAGGVRPVSPQRVLVVGGDELVNLPVDETRKPELPGPVMGYGTYVIQRARSVDVVVCSGGTVPGMRPRRRSRNLPVGTRCMRRSAGLTSSGPELLVMARSSPNVTTFTASTRACTSRHLSVCGQHSSIPISTSWPPRCWPLSKMTWNQSQFDGRLPITLKAAKRVAGILKHMPVDRAVAGRYAQFMERNPRVVTDQNSARTVSRGRVNALRISRKASR